jgi:hypothetical protein
MPSMVRIAKSVPRLLHPSRAFGAGEVTLHALGIAVTQEGLHAAQLGQLLPVFRISRGGVPYLALQSGVLLL